MGDDNENNGDRKKAELVLMPDLLGQQKKYAPGKKQPGTETTVMFVKTMPKRPGPDHKCQSDHPVLKRGIFNDIHAQNGQTGHQQGQDSTVNST